MNRRVVLVAASFGFVVMGLACVDLFHGTDFETLCTRTPADPSCGATDGNVAPEAGDGGIDASPSHPDFCKWSSAEAKNQALHACAWLGACEGPLGESAIGPCVMRAQLAFDCQATPSLRPRGAADNFWACLSTAQSCADVHRCVFPGGVQSCGGVKGGGTSIACGTGDNSSVRIECIGAAPGRAKGIEPCAMLGKTCSPEGQGSATCTGARAFGCAKSECAGTSAVDCQPINTRTIDRGVDCASYGGGECKRVSADGGGFACVPGAGAPTCTIEGFPTCEGKTVTACVGGKDIRVDCSRLGLSCDATKATLQELSMGCQSPDPPSCAVSDKCVSDDLLESCGRGALVQVDCKSQKLGKCQIGPTGSAFCTPP